MLRPLPRLLLLLFSCAGVYLVGNGSVPLWDRDEPRFAQTSRQMLQSGDWVVPRLYDSVRTAKPPLIYWLQASCMRVLGDQGAAGVFAARLPSSIAMLLTLVLVAWVLWRHVGPGHALWTVLILSSCALVVLAAKTGLTDGVLLLFMTAAQICLYAAWRGRATWGVTAVMAVAIALALLTKGPVAVGIQAMTLLALGGLWLTLRPRPGKPLDVGRLDGTGGQRSTLNVQRPTSNEERKEESEAGKGSRGPGQGSGGLAACARLAVGIAIVLAVGLPWVYLVEHRHPGFIRTAFNHEIKDRAATGLEGHKGWPGYYLVSIWPTFLPWSLVLPLALVMAWKRRREPRVRFALAAVAGPWLMFEAVQTKLPHYLLPCFPPLAFLAADAILRALRPADYDLLAVATTSQPQDESGHPERGERSLLSSEAMSPEAKRSFAALRMTEADASVGGDGASVLFAAPKSDYSLPVMRDSSDPDTSLPPASDAAPPFADRGFLNAVGVWAVVAILLGLLPWLTAWWFRPVPWLATAAVSLAAFVYAGLVVAPFRAGRPGRALATMGAGMLGLSLLLFGLYLPAAPFLRLSIDAAAVLREHGATGPGQAVMLDYKEPSLAFYQGGTIREAPATVAPPRLLATCPPWLVITDEVYRAEGTDRLDLVVVARFRGLDLSASLRAVEVLVVRKRPTGGGG